VVCIIFFRNVQREQSQVRKSCIVSIKKYLLLSVGCIDVHPTENSLGPDHGIFVVTVDLLNIYIVNAISCCPYALRV